jgi:hypothetical protein
MAIQSVVLITPGVVLLLTPLEFTGLMKNRLKSHAVVIIGQNYLIVGIM